MVMRRIDQFRLTLVGFITVLVSGCSNYAGTDLNSAVENTPGNYPPTGSRLRVQAPLTVMAGRAGFYLQQGKNLAGKHDRLAPFCYIRFYNVSDTERVIQPDTFVVSDSGIETRLVARNQSPIQFPQVMFRLVDTTPSDILEVVTMRIRSSRQPDVYLLECGGAEAHPANAEPPTLAEIRQALGAQIVLQLP